MCLAVHGKLSQETGRARHFTKQLFTLITQVIVAADDSQPLLAVLTHVSEQVVTGYSDFRCKAPNRFHALGLVKFFFDRAKTRDVVRDDFDGSRRSRKRHQLYDKAAAVFSPPGGLYRFRRPRADAPFDQPVKIVSRLEYLGRKVHPQQFIRRSVAE